jgi:hypothetical protein
MSLFSRIRKGGLAALATATPATSATDRTENLDSVATVAEVAVAPKEITDPIGYWRREPANDSPAEKSDPDLWCWPNSDAMNSAEIDSFASRVSLFSRQGIAIEKAEFLSDSLRLRDRRRDDRRVCIECTHLKRGKCGNYRAAGLQASDIGTDLSILLQRCKGFTAYSFII